MLHSGKMEVFYSLQDTKNPTAMVGWRYVVMGCDFWTARWWSTVIIVSIQGNPFPFFKPPLVSVYRLCTTRDKTLFDPPGSAIKPSATWKFISY